MHDEKLILYYYDDGLSDRERQEVETALGEDTDLAVRYAELRDRLSELTKTDDQPAPAHAVHRWHDSIDRAARLENAKQAKPASPFSFMSFFWGAAVTAALATGIGIGVYFSGSSVVAPVINDTFVDTTPLPENTTPVAFTRGLQVHLRDSRRELARLPTESNADRALLIMGIIEQNRLYERVAEQKDSPKLARVLRAFEPILVRLAAEDLAPEDEEALRTQLAFELNVMLTKLARETSEEATSI
jgi:hypothetical protein